MNLFLYYEKTSVLDFHNSKNRQVQTVLNWISVYNIRWKWHPIFLLWDMSNDFENLEYIVMPFKYLPSLEIRIQNLYTESVWRKIFIRCYTEHANKMLQKMFIEISDLNSTISLLLREPLSSCADLDVTFTACDTTIKPFHVLWMILNVFTLQ